MLHPTQTARYHCVQQSGSLQNSEFHLYQECTNPSKNLRVRDGQILGATDTGTWHSVCVSLSCTMWIQNSHCQLLPVARTQRYGCAPTMNTAQSQSSGNEQFVRSLEALTDIMDVVWRPTVQGHKRSASQQASLRSTATLHASKACPNSLGYFMYRQVNPRRARRICVRLGLSAYRAVSTLHFGYKNQPVNHVYGKTYCLFRDPYKTRQRNANTTHNFWMFNLVVGKLTGML